MLAVYGVSAAEQKSSQPHMQRAHFFCLVKL